MERRNEVCSRVGLSVRVWGSTNRHGCRKRGGGTHDEQHGDSVLATNGDKIRRVGIIAGANDVNECTMVVSEVHLLSFLSVDTRPVTRWFALRCLTDRGAPVRMKTPQSRRGAPNPALFVAVALSSFAVYYILVHHRAATAPASSRPRLNDHPLVWPVHSPDQDRDGSQRRREDH